MKNLMMWMAVAVLVSACGASMGVGEGVNHLASTTVKTNSEMRVKDAVLDVFRAEGFRVLSQGGQSVTFSKPGGRSADLAWKTLNNPNPVMIQPTVSWRDRGAGEVFLACQVEVTQESTVFGETVRQPFLMGKSAYNELLRKVKRQVEAGR